MSKQTVIKVELKLAFKKVNKEDITSILIGKWTKSNYCHVEIIIKDLWISSTLEEGVHIKPLRPLKDTYDYYDIEVFITDCQYTRIMEWVYKQNRKSYDRLGILFSQFIPFRFDSRSKWFCSELVCKILQLFYNKEVMDHYPFLTSPGDLAKIYNLE